MKPIIIFSSLVTLLVILGQVSADVYLHFPRGSNNRLNEASVNRRNANRLFDSQNNNEGGYNVGEDSPNPSNSFKKMYFFEGSKMTLDWTLQHGCGGNSKTNCTVVVQYACDDGFKTYNGEPLAMTDGSQPGRNANPPTTGRHEPDAYRTKCTQRERNKGLWVADQNPGKNADTTRQNPGGTRYGNECPEERDYYPYWHPSPWKDIAVLTDRVDFCDYFQQESMNMKPKYECDCPNWKQGCGQNSECWQYNNEKDCKDSGGNCVWVAKTHGTLFQGNSESENITSPPLCYQHPWTRDNHLGDAKMGKSEMMTWDLPSTKEACGSSTSCSCTLRIRYNISTSDLDDVKPWQIEKTLGQDYEDFPSDHFWIDRRANGDRKIKMDQYNFYENDPVIDMGVGRGLALAFNTAQTGRVFQDRAHMFEIKSRPRGLKNKTIHNVNVRGKRGNIVQVYPAVEYDFVPKYLEAKQGELIHFQWVGSNTNPNNFEGQGQRGTDRNNIMEFQGLNHNYPKPIHEYTMWDSENQLPVIRSFATADKGNSVDTQMNNASPYFDGYAAAGNKLWAPQPGTYYYGSTRNNDFTNRSQKATIAVTP